MPFAANFISDIPAEVLTFAAAMVPVLEGTGKVTVDGVEHLVQKGEALVMPAGKPHAVYGQEAFKMLLVVVFP